MTNTPEPLSGPTCENVKGLCECVEAEWKVQPWFKMFQVAIYQNISTKEVAEGIINQVERGMMNLEAKAKEEQTDKLIEAFEETHPRALGATPSANHFPCWEAQHRHGIEALRKASETL